MLFAILLLPHHVELCQIYEEFRSIRRMRTQYLLILIVLAGIGDGCKSNSMQKEDTIGNKAFVLEMISQKKQLTDYPERASDSMVVYEPSSLPFGGIYRGMKAFEQFYPKVRQFYDFKHFDLQNVYADQDKVFAISKAAIARTNGNILLCEQFTFKQGKIIEVRLYIYDYDGQPVHKLVEQAGQVR